MKKAPQSDHRESVFSLSVSFLPLGRSKSKLSEGGPLLQEGLE